MAVTVFAALEPDSRLATLVQGFKDQTRELVGEQAYLDDPPHMTIYLALFPTADVATEVWQRLAAVNRPIEIELCGWHIFEADPLTGGNTLVCQIAEHDKSRLRSLQREVVEVLAAGRDRRATTERFAPRSRFLTPAQRDCVDQFGFPYLADDWQPHLTIASVKSADWSRLWPSLCPQAPHGIFRCAGLQLYWLDGDRHVRITPKA